MVERKMSEAGSSKIPLPAPSFPMHNSPRVWFITSALSPLIVRLIRQLLAHGDYVAAGLLPTEIEDDTRSEAFRDLINECKSDRRDREGWKDRIRGIRCDGRVMGQCGAAVAEAVEVFGRIDILLCCTSEAFVGTVEELSTSSLTQNLVRDQFETIYFGQVNFIKATLPILREKHTGHIIILTSISGHIGTPEMPMYCASIWALEGYCDSLAFEIAPFNIKLTIVQPNKEVPLLSNRISFSPPLPQYDSRNNPAPGLRYMLTNVANMHPETRMTDVKGRIDHDEVMSMYPRIPKETMDMLILETVHAITAIGGHENPPSRHIVGFEGVASVKEKLRTVNEELEDFVEVSCAVDIFKSDLSRAALSGGLKTEDGSLSTGSGSARLGFTTE